ncbi:MAG: hypothetical protein BWY85_02110 [Firmicutes bacterium ADurb.Bin506]|nr:MAG: hypothetical protein BWY85_02110 [Firmicutes bacterium ADurb.Bin506]
MPKFRQFVTANGRAPEHARFRAASATAWAAPLQGSSQQYLELQSAVSATPRLVPGTLSTAASEPGPSTVATPAPVLNCSHIHLLLATLGLASTLSTATFISSVVAGPRRPAVSKADISSMYPGLDDSRTYTGASVRICVGNDAATTSPSFTVTIPSSVTLPMTTACSPHLPRMFLTSCSRPGAGTSSMRSCDSESITS